MRIYYREYVKKIANAIKKLFIKAMRGELPWHQIYRETEKERRERAKFRLKSLVNIFGLLAYDISSDC